MHTHKTLIIITALLTLSLGYLCVVDPRLRLRATAQEVCAELDGARIIDAVPSLVRGEVRVHAYGFDRAAWRAALRRECPRTMDALRAWAERPR